MVAQLLMGFIEITMDGGVFESSVHALNLYIRTGVIGLCQAMVNAVRFTNPVEQQLESIPVGCTVGELDAVVRQNGVNLVRNSGHESFQERNSNGPCGALMQFCKNQLRRPIDSDEEMQLPFVCAYFRNINVKVADRIGLESFLGGLLARFR